MAVRAFYEALQTEILDDFGIHTIVADAGLLIDDPNDDGVWRVDDRGAYWSVCWCDGDVTRPGAPRGVHLATDVPALSYDVSRVALAVLGTIAEHAAGREEA